mmetsp:Transcript_26264/g.105095  ORF Transcript_26264/g.105095 Transcript_26264/m.105095 type:complete len:437 (-) Transcript_26264:795-2105(-)
MRLVGQLKDPGRRLRLRPRRAAVTTEGRPPPPRGRRRPGVGRRAPSAGVDEAVDRDRLVAARAVSMPAAHAVPLGRVARVGFVDAPLALHRLARLEPEAVELGADGAVRAALVARVEAAPRLLADGEVDRLDRRDVDEAAVLAVVGGTAVAADALAEAADRARVVGHVVVDAVVDSDARAGAHHLEEVRDEALDRHAAVEAPDARAGPARAGAEVARAHDGAQRLERVEVGPRNDEAALRRRDLAPRRPRHRPVVRVERLDARRPPERRRRRRRRRCRQPQTTSRRPPRRASSLKKNRWKSGHHHPAEAMRCHHHPRAPARAQDRRRRGSRRVDRDPAAGRPRLQRGAAPRRRAPPCRSAFHRAAATRHRLLLSPKLLGRARATRRWSAWRRHRRSRRRPSRRTEARAPRARTRGPRAPTRRPPARARRARRAGRH